MWVLSCSQMTSLAEASGHGDQYCIISLLNQQGSIDYQWRWLWCPFYKQFFHCNLISIKNSFCCHPSCSTVIASKFCTWHDSCAVMVCTKFCYNVISHSRVTRKAIFHQIWIMMEKSFVKWADPVKMYTLGTVYMWKIPTHSGPITTGGILCSILKLNTP